MTLDCIHVEKVKLGSQRMMVKRSNVSLSPLLAE